MLRKNEDILKLNNRKIELQKAVAIISSRFINTVDINETINISLADMGKISGASRGYLFLFNEDKSCVTNTHEWCAPNVSPQINNLQNITSESIPWWMNKLKNREIIHIDDVSQLPKEASTEKKILESQDVKSVIVVASYIREKLIGFIGFDNVNTAGKWNNDEVSLLQLVAEIFSNAIQREQSEKALRESEKKFRELFHNTCDCISVHTLGGEKEKLKFIEVNNIATERLGYTREEFLKMGPEDVCSVDAKKAILMLKKVIVELKHVTFETDYITKYGENVPVEVNSHLFILNGEKVVLSIARDITERRKMEKQLMKNNNDLTEMVEKLKQTQAHLIQREQLAGIGQLASGVAHEINNPLGFIMSNFQSLEDYFMTFQSIIKEYTKVKKSILKGYYEEGRETLEKIEKLEKKKQLDFIMDDIDELFNDSKEGLDRVGNIVKGLRVFSRVDHGDEFEDYDINNAVKYTLVVAKSEYKYYANIEEDLKQVSLIEAHAGQINQVLLNIVINAIHSIKENKSENFGVIKVSTYSDDDFVYCDIEDNGAGISKENLNKVFNPFFTTKEVGKGTGLGLFITYDIIVNKHNGEIKVDSIEGEWTKFTIKLPMKQKNIANI